MGYDSGKKVGNIPTKFNKQEPDGQLSSQEMDEDIPQLAIEPIPNLQIKGVNILFDMEVKQCEKNESSMNGNGSFETKAGCAPVSVKD